MRLVRIFVVPIVLALIVGVFSVPAMAAPANDNFASATVLTGAHVTRIGDSSNGATTEGGEPAIAGCSSCSTIWYSWTPTLPGPVTITTAGSNFDTVLGVYTGVVVSSLTNVVENDDDPSTGLLTSRVHFDAVGGTTYHIAVGGYAGDTGSVDLRLYEGPVSTTRVNLTEGGLQVPTCNNGGTSCNSYNGGYDDQGVEGGSQAMSSDGSIIAFVTDSNSVVTGDSGTRDDVFVRNTSLNTTTRVSVNNANATPNGLSYDPSVAASGTKVAFTSEATGMTGLTDGNGTGDVFVRDTTLTPPAAGAMTLVSVNTAGTAAGNDWSQNPAISADGNVVAFESWATNISTAPAGTGANVQVYARNLTTGVTQMVSQAPTGPAQGNGRSLDPSVSADGNFVAFESNATNLIPAGTDTNGARDIFVRNLTTGVTTRVSTDSLGAEANGNSYNPSISADGTMVAFESDANGLVASDTNGRTDVFVKNLVTGATTRVSVRANGVQSVQAKGDSFDPVISPDGRYVLFTSSATNLIGNDTNGTDDIYLHDNLTNVTSRVSVQTGGDQAGGMSSFPDVSANGVVSWTYDSGDLVTNDTNGRDDIFTRTIGFQPDALIKAPLDTAYSGAGIYQTSASGVQAKLIKAPKGSLSTFGIQVQNAGSVSDAFKVAGCSKKPGFKVTYATGGADVTAAVTGATYVTAAVAPDDSVTLTLAVKLSKKAKGSISCPVTVTSASDATKVDQVKATVKALK